MGILLAEMVKVVPLKEVKIVPDITKDIINIGLLLHDGSKMEVDEKVIHINHMGTKINSKQSSKNSLYYLHALRAQKKSNTNIVIDEISKKYGLR